MFPIYVSVSVLCSHIFVLCRHVSVLYSLNILPYSVWYFLVSCAEVQDLRHQPKKTEKLQPSADYVEVESKNSR